MTRREFTRNITILLSEMIEQGEQPIIDYALRSFDEQHRLFEEGLSKCDGDINKSKHQYGTAMDIYLCHNTLSGSIVVDYDWDKEKCDKWHSRWCELGGREMIVFSNGIEDRGHFEGL